VFSVEQMQGATKRTSGRSHSWCAPLRATSSGLSKAPGLPFRKLLKTQVVTFARLVGIARPRERFTSERNAEQRPGRTLVENRFVNRFYKNDFCAALPGQCGGGCGQRFLRSANSVIISEPVHLPSYKLRP
jgi:hypothetical protein